MRITHLLALAVLAVSVLVAGCKGSGEEDLGTKTDAPVGAPPATNAGAASGDAPVPGSPPPGPKKGPGATTG